jgi:5'-deoxynucleotidase
MMPLQPEDVAQHTFGVVLIAHALCVIEREVFHHEPPVEDILTAALLHDASESILTDIVAPVKKYNPQVEHAFAQLEGLAETQLIETLPAVLRSAYQKGFQRKGNEVANYVHAADKLDALAKCKQEIRRGNQDFVMAERQIAAAVQRYAEQMPAVQYFLDTFMRAFERSVDEYRYLQ